MIICEKVNGPVNDRFCAACPHDKCPERKINLACGIDYREGWHNVDIGENIKIDEKVDLLKFPWPWGDDTFDHMECHQFVEHIPHERPEWNGVNGLIKFMDEAYRVAKHGTNLILTHPHQFGETAWCDPTHQRAIGLSVWNYFARPWREDWKFSQYPITSDWRGIEIRQEVPVEMNKLPEKARRFQATHWTNVVTNVYVHLRAWKLKDSDPRFRRAGYR